MHNICGLFLTLLEIVVSLPTWGALVDDGACHIFSRGDFGYRHNVVFQQKAGGRIKGPTSLGIPASADVNDERGGKGGESSFQLSWPTAASETRRKGNSQWNSSVCRQRIKEPSMENSLVSYEALGKLLK